MQLDNSLETPIFLRNWATGNSSEGREIFHRNDLHQQQSQLIQIFNTSIIFES